MLNFHLDVVDAFPGDWSVDPWKGTVKGNALFGRGATEIKGGAAAALFAIVVECFETQSDSRIVLRIFPLENWV